MYMRWLFVALFSLYDKLTKSSALGYVWKGRTDQAINRGNDLIYLNKSGYTISKLCYYYNVFLKIDNLL